MPLYEHVFLARQDISAQQVESLLQDFRSILEERGGSVAKTEYWGLRRARAPAVTTAAVVCRRIGRVWHAAVACGHDGSSDADRGLERPPPLLQGHAARRRRGGRRRGQGRRGRRPPGRARRRRSATRPTSASWPSVPTCGGCAASRPTSTAAGLEVVDCYVSLTELSEYAAGRARGAASRPASTPQLPPEGKPAFCFYPMSKRRGDEQNWFTLPYDERKELMYGHGDTGRKFAGRVLQVVTGSTGHRRLRVGRHALRRRTPTTSRRSSTRCGSTRRRRATRSSGRSTPAWSPRSTRCSTASASDAGSSTCT